MDSLSCTVSLTGHRDIVLCMDTAVTPSGEGEGGGEEGGEGPAVTPSGERVRGGVRSSSDTLSRWEGKGRGAGYS